MSLTIELRPEAEAVLSNAAVAHGLSVESYAGRLLESVLVSERALETRLRREEFQTMLVRLAANQPLELGEFD